MDKTQGKSKIKKYLKFHLYAVIISFSGFLIWSSYFFISNEAPVIAGNFEYNIPYNKEHNLDVYRPTTPQTKKSPVLVFIHGGAWITGTKESINMNRFNGSVKMLRGHGYSVISMSYTLSEFDQSPFPKCLEDVYDALNWVKENSEKYNFDLDNVGLLGESAGGHIALLAAFASDSLIHKALPINLKYLVDVYGPTDLDSIYSSTLLTTLEDFIEPLPSSVSERFSLSRHVFGFNPKEDSIAAIRFMKKYSPISYISNDLPPCLIIQGLRDRVVNPYQSKKLESLLRESSYHPDTLYLKGVDHAFLGASDQQLELIQNTIVDFILSYK